MPIPVSQACKAIADEVEANPDRFIRLSYKARWIRCREMVAELVGAEVDECALVSNTTHGISTVLWNIDWRKGDVIIKSAGCQNNCPGGVTELCSPAANVTYDAIDKAVRYVADISPFITLETVDIGPPYTLDGIFESFEAVFHKVQSSPGYAALTERGERPKIVVVVDALSSNPGLLMPWERVVEFCKGHENVWSLVDAAHAVGQIVGINLSKTQPDFWISVGSVQLSACR